MPEGLAFDSAGNLFAASINNNTIEKINSSGTVTVFVNSGLNSPHDMAVQPVPEPSTWALLAVGLGVVLGGMRLRRRQA